VSRIASDNTQNVHSHLVMMQNAGSASPLKEEKETIDASREGNSLLDVIRILDNLKETMKEEGGEDSEDDGGDDEVL
jgi:hypothetical protein